jgi:hypothetical protein
LAQGWLRQIDFAGGAAETFQSRHRSEAAKLPKRWNVNGYHRFFRPVKSLPTPPSGLGCSGQYSNNLWMRAAIQLAIARAAEEWSSPAAAP